MIISILFYPFLSFVLCLGFGRKLGENGVKWVSCSLLVLSFLFSFITFLDIIINNNLINYYFFSWFTNGEIDCSYGLTIDLVVVTMLILVTGVSSLVHIYSTSYMNNDPHLPRFMSYLSLFTFFMIILVTSNNLVQLFIGWEGVGLCSYLLVNFWFTRIQANKSAIKAMLANKIGDIGLLLALSLIWFNFGSFDYKSIFTLSTIFEENSTLILIGILLLLGVIGKSAQIGLHMWLPDAMEGPTPVSALIHAATMVTAGVFLIIRLSPFFTLLPTILILIVLIGSLTAFFSSVIGLTQNDFKKVIAYSTCSQLGYMVLICGFSYYNLGLYHLINHGFFKALLFLSSGSLIHSLFDEQDMRKAGSIINSSPITYICVLIGSLSLMGLPFLTGFYSKDLIVEIVYGSHILSFALFLAIFSAFLTAFYSFRLLFYSFLQDNQSPKKTLSNSHESEYLLITPLLVLIIFSIMFGYGFQFSILGDELPVILPEFNKLITLSLSILGGIIAIILPIFIVRNLWINNSVIFNQFHSLSNNAWYFDKIISNYLSFNTMKVGFNYTYKIIDNQLLERWGPNWLSNTFSLGISIFSKFYRGYIYSYVYLFVIFVVCFILKI